MSAGAVLTLPPPSPPSSPHQSDELVCMPPCAVYKGPCTCPAPLATAASPYSLYSPPPPKPWKGGGRPAAPTLHTRGSVCEQMRKQCVLHPADRCASPLHAQCAGSLKAHASPRASESGRPHQSEVQGGSRDHTTLPSTAHMTTPSPPDTPTPPDGVFECQGFAWRSVRATEARTGVYGRRTQQRRNPPHHSVALPSAHDTAPAQTPRGFGAPPPTTAHHDPRVAVRTQPWVSVALPR